MSEPSLLLDLTRRYCEPHRHYHTLEHIANMLVLGRDLALTDAQVWAIWFHDAIYDPRSRTNEHDSAELAERSLRAVGWDPPQIAVVKQIVLDTASHRPSIPESADVVDLDLSSIAAPWDEYERNRRNIRKEYAWATEEDFRSGTARFLRGFLARERIFSTTWGQAHEEQARANMQRALQGLQSNDSGYPA